MKVEQEDTDYYIFLSEEEIKKLCNRKPSGIDLDIFPRYYPINSEFTDNKGEIRELEIMCTRNAFILSDEKTHDSIYVDFDDFGPYVKVFTPRLASLLKEREYLVTQYNAESKIWIYRKN